MIFENVRTETMNRGDMNATLAACQLGCERFRLVQRYGVDTVMSAGYDWMDYSERMLARADREDPRRRVQGADRLARRRRIANRGVRLRVETTVRVEGDEITIDLTGSNPEVPTGYNVPHEGSLLVGAYYAVRTVPLDEACSPSTCRRTTASSGR